MRLRSALVAALVVSSAPAAVIRGVVLDRATARPLARSLVALRPVEGTGNKPQSTRANRSGQFTFTVNAGMYFVRASRDGFAPFQYGQKEWKSAGKPVSIEQDGSLYLDIRLRRFGAISGTVFDENEVGISEQRVIAYRAVLPLQIAAGATTDDRGIYRIHGLEPGTYYVRSAPKKLEDDSGLLPTFHKETMTVDQAMTVDVDLDQHADDVDLRPFPGKLVRLTGRVRVAPPVPVTVSLISDAGRAQTKTADRFEFDQLAPGNYQIVVDGDDPYGKGKLGAYQDLALENDREIEVSTLAWRPVEFRMSDENGNSLDPANAKIVARRRDLDGGGRPEVLKLQNGRGPLGPGRWDLSVTAPPGYFVAQLTGNGLREGAHRADGWNEVTISGFDIISIKVSSRPAAIHGIVDGPGHDPAPGAPVYLEAFDKDTQKRIGELRSVHADLQGRYRFTGLAPGLYRIVSTFEYDKPDADDMSVCGAREVNLTEATDTPQDLDLYAP